jgi:hypothetical protein
MTEYLISDTGDLMCKLMVNDIKVEKYMFIVSCQADGGGRELRGCVSQIVVIPGNAAELVPTSQYGGLAFTGQRPPS